MNQNLFTDDQREEIKQIVHDALADYFKSYGLTGKNFVVTTAIILGSIVGIIVSVKTMLAWFGIIVLRQ